MSIRVLIADDQRVIRRALASLLRSAGDVEVVGEAADGQDAVEQALRLRPDVVLMDMSLPLLSGFEATRRISAACPGTRVVGLSMYDAESAGPKAREAGAAAYVAKDASPDEVLAAVRALRV